MAMEIFRVINKRKVAELILHDKRLIIFIILAISVFLEILNLFGTGKFLNSLCDSEYENCSA